MQTQMAFDFEPFGLGEASREEVLTAFAKSELLPARDLLSHSYCFSCLSCAAWAVHGWHRGVAEACRGRHAFKASSASVAFKATVTGGFKADTGSSAFKATFG